MFPTILEIPAIPEDAFTRYLETFNNSFQLKFQKRSEERKRTIFALVANKGLEEFVKLTAKRRMVLSQLPLHSVTKSEESFFFIVDFNNAKFVDEYEERLSAIGDARVVMMSELRNLDDFKQILIRRIIELSREDEKILSYAIHYGYFDIPKKITLGELANKLNISKTSLDVKLRKSIGRIIGRLIEMYEVYYSLLGV